MKLLSTATGLLASTVKSNATADGHYGVFAPVDWAVTIAESAVSVTALATQTPTPALGWDPMVTGIIATYDGGKAMVGAGKVDGYIYNGWIVKMFGATGGLNCGDDAKPTGWITLTTGVNTGLASTDECMSETQWTYAGLTYDSPSTADNQSEIYLAMVEDFKVGAIPDGVSPFYYGVGGMSAFDTFGLGNWNAYLLTLTFDGLPHVIANVHQEHLHKNGSIATFSKASAMGTNGCYTAVDMEMWTTGTTANLLIGGITASTHDCLTVAIHGYVTTGIPLVYKFIGTTVPMEATLTMPTLATAQVTPASLFIINNDTQGAGINVGSVTQVTSDFLMSAHVLITSHENYCDSQIIGTVTANMDATPARVALTKAIYGSVRAFFGVDATQQLSTNLVSDAWTHIFFIGSLHGEGKLGVGDMTTFAMALATSATSPLDDVTRTSGGVLTITAPPNGLAQFRGLAYSTTEATYVEMVCIGLQPVFAVAAWQGLSQGNGAGNGWMTTCMTGISSCTAKLADGTALDASQVTSCHADPRYQTWRMVTGRHRYDGALLWYRTDSYWNPASYAFGSSWGPGIKLSANIASGDDNNGATAATHVGKTFVYAMSDGSGVQMYHIQFQTGRETNYVTGLSGGNTIVSQATTFSRHEWPDRFQDSYCQGYTFLLDALEETTGLSTVVTDWSDGYRGKLMMTLDVILAGQKGGWRGVCLVPFTSQYVQDATGGSLCHAVSHDDRTASGPFDFGGSTLFHVPASIWSPPAKSAPVAPAALALTDAKLMIKHEPTVAVASILTASYYASAQWYQPKPASTYERITRFGKDDFVGVYCFQGADNTSYFQAPGPSYQLTGATSLFTSVIALSFTLSLAL